MKPEPTTEITVKPVWNPWLTCLDCGYAQFVPDPDDQTDAESNPIRCPKCKSMKLTWNSTICAWCAKVHNITVPPGQSHGICARHQAEEAGKLNSKVVFTTIASAHWDPDGWMLFDSCGNAIEEWPTNWPERVDRKFLEERGIDVE